MGRMVAEFRILVDPGADAETVRGKVAGSVEEVGGELLEVEASPLAFGITSLKTVVSAPESEGITERLIEVLSGIEGVSSVEVARTTRVG